MLEVCGLTKRYNGIPAVRDVSFTLKPGEDPSATSAPTARAKAPPSR